MQTTMKRTIQRFSVPTSHIVESPLTSLPTELICHVICLLCPQDVVRFRTVCKQFYQLSYDPVIWKTLYANAHVPRPPGPFPSQSTRSLERTLVQSARLADSWTKRPIEDVSSTQIRLEGPPMGHPRIICGRWLITFESYSQIVVRDIETRSRQVLWEDRGLIASWDTCSVSSPKGQLIYIVVRESVGGHWRAPWKLLEFRVDSESGQLHHSVSLHVPARQFGGSMSLVGGNAPILYMPGQGLIFDTRTRLFYEFPEFGSGVDGIRNQFDIIPNQKVLLTNSHIIVLSYLPRYIGAPSPEVASTLIQAFSIPSGSHPASNGVGVLHLTHEGIIHDNLSNVSLIRNSTVDTASGTTNLRFVYLRPETNALCFPCLDISLPTSYADTILSMTIDVYDVFTVEGGMYDSAMCGYYIQASDDGHVRGFCRNRTNDGEEHDGFDDYMSITKFSIDATQDKCVAVVGDPSPPRWTHVDDFPRFSMLSFDGIVGRFCYLRGEHNWRLNGHVDAVVVDIK